MVNKTICFHGNKCIHLHDRKPYCKKLKMEVDYSGVNQFSHCDFHKEKHKFERKKTRMINGKEYRRGSSTYVSEERAQGYAKLLRESGMNAIIDNFKEKSKYENKSRTWYFYWIRKKNKKLKK